MTDRYDNSAFDVDTAILGADTSDLAALTPNDDPCPIITDGRREVRAVYKALSGRFRRRLKVLDLGHSPFRPSLSSISEREPASAEPDSCDLLLCTVLRCAGDERVRGELLDAVGACADKVGVVLCETVWNDSVTEQRDEPPDDLRRQRDDFAFVHTISESDDGQGRRALLFCSNRYWYAEGDLDAFYSWTSYSNEIIGEFREGTRRYFFCADKITKCYCFRGSSAQDNRRDMGLEISFLSNPPIEAKSIPRLLAQHIGNRDGILVKERLPGMLLSTLILQEMDYDPTLVLSDVLTRLDVLERVGLYHGDVGPWDVLVDNNGDAVLIDFASITEKR